jgi:hypothetical protein
LSGGQFYCSASAPLHVSAAPEYLHGQDPQPTSATFHSPR